MTEEPQKTQRENVVRIFLTRALLNGVHKFMSEKDLDENQAMFIVIAEGLRVLDCLSQIRYERTVAKYSVSILQKEDKEFLEVKQKLKEDLEAKIREETDNRAKKWVLESKPELDKMTEEDKRKAMIEKLRQIESEVRKEGEKQE